MKARNIIAILITLFILAVMGAALAELWESVIAATKIFLVVAVVFGGLLAIGLAFIVGARVYDWLDDMWEGSKHDRKLKEIERQRLRREANVETIIAPAGSQIIRHVTNNFDDICSTPLHLEPSAINGSPSAFDSDDAQKRWLVYMLAYGKGGSNKALPVPTPAIEVDQPLPNLLPELLQAKRRCIGGGSDSGKSTVAKILIAKAIEAGSKVMVLSPHESPTFGGVPVCGVGRNYTEIGIVLQALVDLMTYRYDEVGRGIANHFDHHDINIYLDEWTSIKRQVPNAGELLGELLTEGRKVSMSLTVLTHSLNVETLGVDSGLRNSFMLCWLSGGNGKDFRAQRVEYGLTGKKTITEFRHPGDTPVFIPKIPDSFIVDIPSSEETKAIRLKAQGLSDTAIAKEVCHVKKPNKSHIDRVRQLYATATI